jgi:hypothetical protein
LEQTRLKWYSIPTFVRIQNILMIHRNNCNFASQVEKTNSIEQRLASQDDSYSRLKREQSLMENDRHLNSCISSIIWHSSIRQPWVNHANSSKLKTIQAWGRKRKPQRRQTISCTIRNSTLKKETNYICCKWNTWKDPKSPAITNGVSNWIVNEEWK